MKTIKVTTSFPDWPLTRQLPGRSNEWGNYKFYVNEKIKQCDYWIIYENLVIPEETFCSPNGIIFFGGEPEYIKRYSSSFLKKFSLAITCQKSNLTNVKNSQTALPWHISVHNYNRNLINIPSDYDTFISMSVPPKRKLISVISSNKNLTDGQLQRLKFVQYLKEQFNDDIDIYGRGFNEVIDKWDAIANYKYHIVLENCSIEHYWTEKLADCFLAESYPIYWGCKNIYQYFSEESLSTIDIYKPNESIDIIRNILSTNRYEHSLNDIKEAKNKVLNKYNFFNVAAEICSEIDVREMQKKKIYLYPEKYFSFRIKNMLKNILK